MAKSHKGQESAADGANVRHRRRGFLSRIRAYFVAGILVTAPIGLTFYLVWLIIDFVDDRVVPLIPPNYNPETYLPEMLQPIGLPGLGLLIAAFVLSLIGWLAAGVMGRVLLRWGETILARMPVVRNLYSAIKQILETVLAQQSQAFREVVLFEYPRRGCWAMGFITGSTIGEVQALTEDDVVNVFLPTTPNPTSGYLLFVPKRELVILSMTVEEGIKMIVSGGIVTPPDRRSDQQKKIIRVAPADGDAKTIKADAAE